ncbi:MAG: MptD family putative ECF transporter S component [Micropruina sp.]|nr:MptD family putative ECF transporter S component [Micropruina sp.]
MSDESHPVPQGTRTRPAPPDRRTFSLRLSARDLLNVAIFAVIYLVIVFAINMLGLINPLVMFLALLLSIIVSSVPYMLFLTRVKHAGVVTLFGVVMGLFCGLSGLGWISAGITVAMSLIGELILAAGDYRSRRAAIGANTVFALWYAGPMVPILIDREEYLRSSEFQLNGPEYVAAFDQLVTLPVVWAYFAGTLVCGFLGALLGSVLLKKHFVRAGLA